MTRYYFQLEGENCNINFNLIDHSYYITDYILEYSGTETPKKLIIYTPDGRKNIINKIIKLKTNDYNTFTFFYYPSESFYSYEDSMSQALNHQLQQKHLPLHCK